jgi:hypothetical protein
MPFRAGKGRDRDAVRQRIASALSNYCDIVGTMDIFMNFNGVFAFVHRLAGI